MTSTTAPITVSITLPLIRRFTPLMPAPPNLIRAASLFRRPRLVIADGALPLAAAQNRACRTIGVRGPGHVRQMLFLPGIAGACARMRDLVNRVMQPGVPLGRHLRSFRGASVHDPSFLTACPTAAAHQLPPPLFPVVAVAEAVNPNILAAQPSQQSCAKGHRSIRAEPRAGATAAAILSHRRRHAGKSRNGVSVSQEMATFG